MLADDFECNDESLRDEEYIYWDDVVYDEAYFQKRLTTLIYFHPYYTYHAVPLEDIGREPAKSEDLPYSIPIGTYEREKREQFTILPKDIDERRVLWAFRKRFKQCDLDDVLHFLDFQYKSYLEKAVPYHNPTLFLEYLISTIDEYEISLLHDRLDFEYSKFKVLGRWVRSHPGWIESFDKRLRNWANISDYFWEMSIKERNHFQQEIAEANLEKEKEAAAKEEADSASKLLETKKAVVQKRLAFLSGFKSLGRRIMEQDDLNLLVEYTHKMVEIEDVPEIVKPILNLDVPMGHLRYTYYLIHREIYAIKPRRKYFINFLYAVFPNHFNEDKLQWSTTYTKFSDEPKSYYADIENYGEAGKKGKI